MKRNLIDYCSIIVGTVAIILGILIFAGIAMGVLDWYKWLPIGFLNISFGGLNFSFV